MIDKNREGNLIIVITGMNNLLMIKVFYSLSNVLHLK